MKIEKNKTVNQLALIIGLVMILISCVANRYSNTDISAQQVLQQQNYKISRKAMKSNKDIPNITGRSIFIDEQSRKGVSFIAIYEWLKRNDNSIQTTRTASDYQLTVLEEFCNTDFYTQDFKKYFIFIYHRDEKTIAESKCKYSIILNDEKSKMKKEYSFMAETEEIVKESVNGFFLIFPINASIDHRKSEIDQITIKNQTNW